MCAVDCARAVPVATDWTGVKIGVDGGGAIACGCPCNGPPVCGCCGAARPCIIICIIASKASDWRFDDSSNAALTLAVLEAII